MGGEIEVPGFLGWWFGCTLFCCFLLSLFSKDSRHILPVSKRQLASNFRLAYGTTGNGAKVSTSMKRRDKHAMLEASPTHNMRAANSTAGAI